MSLQDSTLRWRHCRILGGRALAARRPEAWHGPCRTVILRSREFQSLRRIPFPSKDAATLRSLKSTAMTCHRSCNDGHCRGDITAMTSHPDCRCNDACNACNVCIACNARNARDACTRGPSLRWSTERSLEHGALPPLLERAPAPAAAAAIAPGAPAPLLVALPGRERSVGPPVW